jgi:hypothetical protein
MATEPTVTEMSVTDLFQNVSPILYARQQGWGLYYYGYFSELIQTNHYTTVAEIGVGYGTHARYNLDNCPDCSSYTTIDPMIYYYDDPFPIDIAQRTSSDQPNNFNLFYSLVETGLQPYGSRVRMLRKSSQDVTDTEIPTGSLDACFIDGNHSLVLEDCQAFWPRIRSGGCIMGTEFQQKRVSDAVQAFSDLIGVPYTIVTHSPLEYQMYVFRKP